ncbi:PspA/IM30 family protein [Neobacillus notoginsengisoli]|uniref:PspA/IM30 family protein n=1 Tax=Neobacillus notoginsengisoli TaxID=1578198 RepID=A0A417YWQ1_9BACI|nr:PspA/IM30 family protein [Neobacillus notoginsengisoli]RHW41744.1 PspA/IM30 family protein [Neobacillus notoginsengisoli]
MANLFMKLKNTVMADLHEAIDQKERKNPIAMLNEYLRQCEKETEKVRDLVERQHALKDEFVREYNQAKEMAEKRKYQADIAAKAGELALQEFAEREHLHFSDRAIRLEGAMEQAARQLAELEARYEEMKHKLKDMNIRRLELMGRENISRANHRINQVVEAGELKSDNRFRDIETYLDNVENEVNSSYFRNTIDARIAQLEKEFKNQDSQQNAN